MIGQRYIEIGETEFLDGMTTSPHTTDGGYSPETTAVNVLSVPDSVGVLYAPADIVDSSTNLNGNIIATCTDPDSGIGINNYILTSTGRFISSNSSGALTVRRTTGGGKTYSFPNSDMVIYRNELFATSETDITRATGANLVSTFDEAWWTSTKSNTALTSGVRHPLVVFEDSLWIGDGNKLHKWDGTTDTEGFLTLPTGAVIIALGVDSSSGKLLITTSDGPNGSDTLPRTSKVLVFNGYSNKPDRAVVVDDLVTAIYPLGGTVFITYGQNLGYWNGGGITYITQFTNVTLSGTSLVYKHRITNIGRVLYIADGIDILAFGDTTQGKKRFWVAQRVTASFNSYLDAIFNIGENRLGIGYDSNGSTPKFYIFTTTAKTTGLLNFYSKKYKFPRLVSVRSVYVEYADQVTANTTPGTLTIRGHDRNGQLTTITMPALTNSSNSYLLYSKMHGNADLFNVQLIYENSATKSVIAGVRRFIIYYDVVE